MSKDLKRIVEIGLLIYPEVHMATVLGLTDLFNLSNKNKQDAQFPTLKVSHWQFDCITQKVIRINETYPKLHTEPSIIILPPSLADPISIQLAQTYIPWLRQQNLNGAILASICAGAFLLGETGLIQNQKITLHWQHKELFEKRFPHIQLDLDPLIIDTGEIITAGGVMAWVDLGLQLVERYLDRTTMLKTAQILLVDPPGRQQSYYRAFSPKFDHGDDIILKVQKWLQDVYTQQINLSDLAKYACMEERTFLRRFKKATEMTSIDYCQHLRVDHAREKLQNSQVSIDRISWEVGYNDPSAFRKVFNRIIGLTPSEYRQRFNSNLH